MLSLVHFVRYAPGSSGAPPLAGSRSKIKLLSLFLLARTPRIELCLLINLLRNQQSFRLCLLSWMHRHALRHNGLSLSEKAINNLVWYIGWRLPGRQYYCCGEDLFLGLATCLSAPTFLWDSSIMLSSALFIQSQYKSWYFVPCICWPKPVWCKVQMYVHWSCVVRLIRLLQCLHLNIIACFGAVSKTEMHEQQTFQMPPPPQYRASA